MTGSQRGGNEGLARRILGQHVVRHDPGAVINDACLRRARSAHAAIASLLDEVASKGPAMAAVIEILSGRPGATNAFRTGVRVLSDWLDRNPSSVAAFSAAAREAERRSHLSYHLGDRVDAKPERRAVGQEPLTLLVAPGVNPAKERAELAVIVPVGFPDSHPQRLRNCTAVLHALNRQRLDRSLYRVVVVEQGARPRADAKFAGLVDDYVFAENPGEFNKSWALNIGVNVAAGAVHLCLLDADALPDEDFLAGNLDRMRAGETALLPFSTVLHLDEASAAEAVRQRLPIGPGGESATVDDRWLRGFSLSGVNGFCVWVTQERYRSVGGHDERYRGWGGEDNAFHRQLVSAGGVRRLPGTMLHLWHPRPHPSVDSTNRPNTHLLFCPRPPADVPLGDLGRYAGESERRQFA